MTEPNWTPPINPPQPIPPQPFYTPPKKKHTLRNVLLIVVAALVALCGVGTIVAAATGGGKPTNTAATHQVLPSSTAQHIKPGEVDANRPTPEVIIIPSPTPAGPQLTAAQQQAKGAAEDYLRFMNFSRKGLIGQLVHDGFAQADAAVGIDTLGVDWNAQAAGSAKSYLDLMHFSHSGLVGQLVHDGYTQAQAEYGVKAAGL